MISPTTLAAVRDRADIVALVGETVKLTKRGRAHLGLCPFHKEKSPSFSVNAERGFFYCFGCKENGSVIDFVMKLEGKTFPEAVRDLAERFGVDVEELGTDAERRQAASARREIDDLYAVNALAATYYEQCLWRPGPGAHLALAELRRRALPDQLGEGPASDALRAFRVGYAPAGWNGLATYLQRQGAQQAAAERAGLLVPRTGGGHYDRFRHRLMFAVLDPMGRCVGFSGRALPEPSAEELRAVGASPADRAEPPAKYMNTPETAIFKKGEQVFGLFQARVAVRQAGRAVVVEGNFDVVSLHAQGFHLAVAPLGTAFTEAQARLLKRFAPTATLLFDPDTAGRKATHAARVPCLAVGLGATAARLPPGADPDEYLRAAGPEALRRVLAGARDLREVIVDDLLEPEAFARAGIEERIAKVREVGKLLAQEEDPVARGMLRAYADRIAAQLVEGRRVADVTQLEAALRQELRGRGAAAPGPAASPADPLQLGVLGALIDYPALFDHPDVTGAGELLEGPPALAFAALRAGGDPVATAARLPAEVRDFVLGRAAAPEAGSPIEALRALTGNLARLRARGRRRRVPAP